MTNPTSVDIKDVLVAAGVGSFAGSSAFAIFIGKEPQAISGKIANEVVTIYDTGGDDPEPFWLLDRPTIMIRVRGAVGGYLLAHKKATEIKNVLLNLDKQTINGTVYDMIGQEGEINQIGFDVNERPLFTLNFRIMRQPANDPADNRLALS